MTDQVPTEAQIQHAEQVCETLWEVYRTGRIKIVEQDGLVFWCNFYPPRFSEDGDVQGK